MRELFIEYKPCSKTIYEDGNPILPMLCTFKAHVIDGKCTDFQLNITEDFKYVYATYKLKPTFFRINNISSKPFVSKEINEKLRKYRKMKKQVDEIKKRNERIIT